jgi:hypothetical protein
VPSRNRRKIAFLITWKKAAASRSLAVLLAGFLALLAYVWVKDSFNTCLRFFHFFFPYIFLFLAQDMFRDEVDGGALENVLFLGGGFRDYLLAKNLVLTAIALALSAAIFLALIVYGISARSFSSLSFVQFLIGVLVGVYYLLAGGLLSFFFKGGSNVLLIILGQVFLVVGLFLSATQRTGWIDLLTADALPDAAAKLKFFLLAAVLPNVIIGRRSAVFVLGLAALAALLFIVQRFKIKSVEILKR